MSERASKRRKLDTDSTLSRADGSSTTARANPKSGSYRSVDRGNGNTRAAKTGAIVIEPRTSRARRNDDPISGPEGPEKKERTKHGLDNVNADNEKVDENVKATSAHRGNGERRSTGTRRKSPAAVSKNMATPRPALANGTEHGTYDASPDGEERRTSGRKRQVSRKLEEAQRDMTVIPTRSSPATQVGSANRRRTPTSARLKTVRGTIGSTPSRGNRTALSKETRSYPEEIPDSEPDVEDKTEASSREFKNSMAVHGKEDGASTGPSQPSVQNHTSDRHNTGPQSGTAIRPNVGSEKTTSFAKSGSTKVPTTPSKAGAAREKFVEVSPRKPNGTPASPAARTGLVQADDLLVDEAVEFDQHDIDQIKVSVTRQLTGRPNKSSQGPFHPLEALDMEHSKVANLVAQTVTTGESNSMVIIGARGSGKSALVDNVIREQQIEHANDFHVVRLSGFIHTDDKVAIREIWRQLGREMEIEDASLVKNYADTLTSLLALLSHPSETGQDVEGRMAKSVIIILDEFDLFTTHPRQTLLYNLFDIAQSRKAPVAVLGLTTRYDVPESLEKRVKSRFSHRQLYIPLAKNFATFKTMCLAHLTLPASSDLSHSAIASWNNLIASLSTTSSALNHLLQHTYHTTKSVPAFLAAMLLPIASLTSPPGPSLTRSISLAPRLSPPDSSLTLLPSLSGLQLGLLIAAARLVIVHDTDAVTFPLAYDEYKNLASKARIAASAAGALAVGAGARVWAGKVARGAWEGLLDKGLVIGDGERGGRVRVDVSLEEIGAVLEGGGVEGVGSGMVKWCKEI